MSDEKIVQNIIEFIEEKEKDYIAEKFGDGPNKTDVVNAIIRTLDQELDNENK